MTLSSPTAISGVLYTDLQWIEGLRGIAAFVVVTGHVLEALSPIVLAPAQSFHGSFLFMQLPFVRLLHSGRVSVAAFALIAGLVNALKPIRLMQLGERNKALSSIALSAFRRTGRLVLPTSVATIIAFFLTQIGSFEVAKHANQQWIRNISPARPKSFSQAFNSLLRNLITTWTKGDNDYDKIQWTITFFLQAAMWTYMILVATAHVTSKGRLLVYSGLYCYFWYAKNPLIGINVCFGLILAEFAQSDETRKAANNRNKLIAISSSCLIFLGLYISSFPTEHADWAHWSHSLATICRLIIPKNGELSRYVHSLGVQILFLGVFFSTTAKRILSHRILCQMGKVSFAVYLIHPLFLRTILVWMLYGLVSLPPDYDEDGKPIAPGILIPSGGPFRNFASILTFYLVSYTASTYWTLHVESWCAQVLAKLEAVMLAKENFQTNETELLPK